jgi:hypothetical protein
MVLLSVEVEVVAVAAGEARVPAGHTRVEVTHYMYVKCICINIYFRNGEKYIGFAISTET